MGFKYSPPTKVSVSQAQSCFGASIIGLIIFAVLTYLEFRIASAVFGILSVLLLIVSYLILHRSVTKHGY